MDDLIGRGATEAASARDLAANSDVVILCVTGAPQVEALVYGQDGMLGAARPGWILIDATTSVPALTRRIAGDLAEHGAGMADAPVTRAPKDAEAGRLNTLAGADRDFRAHSSDPRVLLRNGGAFRPRGCRAYGQAGEQHFITMGYTALISEGMAVAAAADVRSSQALRHPVPRRGRQRCAAQDDPALPGTGDLTGHQFAIGNGFKDVGYFAELVEDVAFASILTPRGGRDLQARRSPPATATD